MLTHELSKPQQPNLYLEDACCQDLPGTAGSLGVPEPPAVHVRAPMQHYDFNINAIPFEPLSLKRGAAAPNAQQTFQHTSDAKPVRCLGPSFQDGERLLFLQVGSMPAIIHKSTCSYNIPDSTGCLCAGQG
ncbi:hypothetical protein WJX79_007255 [Trebouxia sp. C0005]